MLRAFTVVAALLAGAGLTAALTPLVTSGKDYTSLPPDLATVEKELTALPTSIEKAITIARANMPGVVRSAQIVKGETATTVEVEIINGGKGRRIVIDPMTGMITDRKILSNLPGEPVEGEPATSPLGVKYYDIKVGDGASPRDANATVTVHYSGYLVDGTKFDSSIDKGAPATIAMNSVVKGWPDGVLGMKVGGKRKIVIPYELGWGDAGNMPKIPPKATVIFDIELIRNGP
jgi:hypothetical protein